jgi:phage tail sheath protein FI
MGFLVSPGVEVNETDLTDIIPTLSTSVAGYAGYFNWGPVGELVNVGSEKDLARYFGAPKTASNAETSFFTAASFLKYGNNLKVSRATDGESYNARAGGAQQVSGISSTANTQGSFGAYTAYGLPDEDTITEFVQWDPDTLGSPPDPGYITYTGTPDEVAEIGIILKASSAAPSVGGTNFTVGELLTFNIATGDNVVSPVFEVASLGASDSIATLTLVSAGSFKTTEVLEAIRAGDANNEFSNIPAAYITTSGSGDLTGVLINVQLTVAGFDIVDGGNGYEDSPTLYVKINNTFAGSEHYYEVTTYGYAENYTVTDLNTLVALADELNDSAAGVIARYPGDIGNGLQVFYVDGGNYLTTDTTVKAVLPFKPSQTDWAVEFTGLSNINDELHVVVVDGDGAFTGTSGAVLEVHSGMSVAQNSTNEYGESNYYVTIVNNNSSYVWLTPETSPTVLTADESLPIVKTYEITPTELGGGTDGDQTGADGVITALELFEDVETVDVNLLFAQSFADSGLAETATANIDAKVLEIANTRKDLVAFISAPMTIKDATSDNNKLTAVLNKFELVGSTSYAVLDSTPVYVYNKYRDGYLWIPAAGHMAGLCANADDVAEPWFSPAGFNRGNLLGVVKVAFNPKQAARDDLYSNRINPIVSFPGQGIVLFGDKTALTKPSAFDRINVRRLFTTIEKAIATAAKYQLFELNDEFTRATFRNAIEPYLRNVQGRRGITDFRVVCDTSNNTAEVIDGNRFVADIYVKPARSINFISLNFIATRTGVAFEELIGR